MSRFIKLILGTFLVIASGCKTESDELQQDDQEKILLAATNAVGLPAIKNFQERRLLKMILELRDQEHLSTYTYLWNPMQGKLVLLCQSIGYGIPYATQYTNPQKRTGRAYSLPQADPNGLFSPASADGTWVMCLDSKTEDVKPVYVEPPVVSSPFPLDDKESK